MEFTTNSTLLNAPDVEIQIDPNYGENCMHFIFKGEFTDTTASNATQVWSQEFDRNQNRKYTHVWNCLQMKGFEYSARDVWMHTLKKYSDRIESISVVSDSLLIRGAARLMSKFSSLDLSVYKTLEDMKA